MKSEVPCQLRFGSYHSPWYHALKKRTVRDDDLCHVAIVFGAVFAHLTTDGAELWIEGTTGYKINMAETISDSNLMLLLPSSRTGKMIEALAANWIGPGVRMSKRDVIRLSRGTPPRGPVCTYLVADLLNIPNPSPYPSEFRGQCLDLLP